MAGTVTRAGQALPISTAVTQGAGAVTGSGTALDSTQVPYVVVVDENNPAGKVPLMGVAQEGTDSSDTNAIQATAGVGIRGWLSTLVSLFRAGTARVISGTTATATLTTVAASATTVTVLAANSARKGCVVTNDGTAVAFLAYASSASLTAYTYQIPANSAWEMPPFPIYTGALSAIWSSAVGNLRVTEF